MKRILALLALSLLLVPLFASSHAETNSTSQVLTSAENFLVSQYNASIGLLSEHPGSNFYWLYSDNYLALLAFKQANSSDTAKQTAIMNNANSTLSRYMTLIPNAKNQYMVFSSNVFDFNDSHNYELTTVEGSIINITLNNMTGTLDPHIYGDIAFLESVYYNDIGNKSEALSMFQIGASMYNGIGINDSIFIKYRDYQTYKLALYIYAATLLGESYPSSVKTNLLAMQNTTNGGFYSDYAPDYSTAGHDANVETTSLAILALAKITTTSSSTTASSTITSRSSSTSSRSMSSSLVPIPTSTASTIPASTSQTVQVTTSTSNTGGGIPEFPFQFAITALFTILIVASYLAIRRLAK